MTATVRPVGPDDKAEWSRMWKHYLAFYDTSRSQDVFEQTWRRIVEGSHGMYAAIAEMDGHAVGIVNFLYHNWFWGAETKVYLNDLYVDPDIRGTGAGRALIEYVDQHARSNGAGSVYWLTAEDNEAARRLYDRIAQKSVFVHYSMTPGG
jgi:GNAT superfamily N-acetyltransferase